MTLIPGWLPSMLVAFLTTSLAAGDDCQDIEKVVICHIETSLDPSTDPCYCSHIVLHRPHDTELVKGAERLRQKNPRLKVVVLREDSEGAVGDEGLSGLYLRPGKSLSKDRLLKDIKRLASELDNLDSGKRANSKYSSSQTKDDPSKTDSEIILELPVEPQQLAKHYDLKALSKYVSYFVLRSDNLTDATEAGLAYHPARLMGIDDILNADSLIDLVSGLGGEHSKLVISLPATALKFTLEDPADNMPRAKVAASPQPITQTQLCSLMGEGSWTLERDEDLTAPYAYSNTTWIAFDDTISTSIKAKYVLLRGLAGLAVSRAEADDWGHGCSSRPLLDSLYSTLTSLSRKPRAATLLSLQDQIHNTFSSFGGDVQLSPFRIVRVVDRAGSVHVVRKEAKTEFQCSRQGYFTHPLGCNRFYRCVKFNQLSSDFTVFEYDCPAGLAFDERYEVCVWPGSLPDASACKGSSEIAPVPRSRYACSGEGYFADPENCRWFFACLDHRRDGSLPTAYEFRCPFGLVFNGATLACDWPWTVGGCGSGAGLQVAGIYPGDILEGRLRPAYAQVSDVHVSGGRIADVDGGLVLGTNLLSGIGSGSIHGGSGYSDGGIAGQVNAAFGNAYEDNSGAYIHDSTGDTGGEYIHQESLGGPGSPAYIHQGGAGGSNLLYSGELGGSGAYVHDSRGDTAGVYVGGGSGGAGSYSSNVLTGGGSAGILTSGGSGSYNHDARGDAGGVYVQGSDSGGIGSYSSGVLTGGDSGSVQTSGISGGSGTYLQNVRGGVNGVYVQGSGYGGTGSYSSGVVNGGVLSSGGSGAYVHDTRGDTGGAYLHVEGAQGPGAVPYAHTVGTTGGSGSYSSGVVSGGTATGSGVLVSGGTLSGTSSGAYVHDIRGNAGGYVHLQGSQGIGAVPYVNTLGITKGSGSYSTGVVSEGGVSGSGVLVGGSFSGAGDSGAYVHDTTGDTGGDYVHVEGPQGPGAVPYLHSQSGDGYTGSYASGGGSGVILTGTSGGSGGHVHDSRGDIGATYLHQGGSGGYLSGTGSQGYIGGQNVVGLGGYTGGYLQGSRGSYIHTQSPSGVLVNGGVYASKYIHDNSGAYVHDTTGDFGVPYIHQEGPSGPLGSGYYQTLYRDQGYKNLYVNQYAPGYVVNKNQQLLNAAANYGTKVHLYQPQAPVVHTYDTSRLNVQAGGYLQSPVAYQQPIVKTSSVSPITVTSRPVIPLNPVQYVTPSPVVVSKIAVSTPSPPIVNYQYEAPVVRTQTVSPITVTSSSPALQYHQVDTHVIQPVSVSTPSPPVINYSYQSPAVHAQTVGPIAVSNAPVAPLNPVQYVQPAVQVKTHDIRPVVNTIQTHTIRPISIGHGVENVGYEYQQPAVRLEYPSTPAPPIIRTQTVRPIISSSPPLSYQPVQPIAVQRQPVIPLNPVQYQFNQVHGVSVSPQAVAFSTPAPPLTSFAYHPVVKAQSVQPVAVTSPPVVPLSPVQYGIKVNTNEYGYDYQRPVVPFNYQRPVLKTQSFVSSTPAPPVVSYSYHPQVEVKPLVNQVYQSAIRTQTVSPTAFGSTPVPPVVSYSYHPQVEVKPLVNQVYQSGIRTQTVSPITVSSTPLPPVVSYSYHPQVEVKPLINQVYQSGIRTHTISPIAVSSTPAPPVVSYSYPAVDVKPAVQQVYQQAIRTQSISPITVSSTPAVPLSPVQYHVKPQYYPTPAVNYQESFVKAQPVAPITVSSTPIVPLSPIQYGPKVSSISYSYDEPIVKQPIAFSAPAPALHSVRTQTIRPIVISSTPVVPLSPVQYGLKTISQEIGYDYPKPAVAFNYPETKFVSTQAPPVVSYTYQKPVIKTQPIQPIAVSTPAPVISYQPYEPVIRTQTVRPIVIPTTPAIPLSPIQYGIKSVQPPIAIGSPAPVINQSYQPFVTTCTSCTRTQTVRPIVVSSTPSIPLSPVQYGVKTVESVGYSYQPPARPLQPIAVSTPAPPIVSYSYQPPARTLQPIAVSTPAPPVVSYSYQPPARPLQPIAVSTPAPPVVSYSYQPPARPLQPIAVSTPAPPVVSYSYQPAARPLQPIAVNTPAPPVVSYSYQPPTRPLQPIAVSTPAPPVVSYSYQPAARPLQPIAVNTPAPPVVSYSYQPAARPLQPIAVNTPAPPVVSYSYQPPARPLQPIAVSTPAPPIVNYSYRQPTVRPITFTSTPVVPLNPIQYPQTRLRPAIVTTSAPVVSYSYEQQPAFRTQTVRPVTVTQSPVVPLNPVQYVSTSRPFINYSYQSPAIKTQTVVTQPPVVDYYDEEIVRKPAPVKPLVSYSYEQPARPTVAPITVTETPVVPFNRVQHIGPARTQTPAVFGYKYGKPKGEYQYQEVSSVSEGSVPCCGSPTIQVTTQRPSGFRVASQPAILSTTSRPSVGAFFEEYYESNRNEGGISQLSGGYEYRKPVLKFEEQRPLIKQQTFAPVIIPQVSTVASVRRPVQTYANTVEEESYISSSPDQVTTIVKQPVRIDTSDENLNLNLDIPKIGVSGGQAFITSTTPGQIVEVTTVTPVVKRVRVKGGLTRGGYYVRRQKVRVQPVVTTSENYPAYFTTTVKPVYSTSIDLTSPTFYRTTVRPVSTTVRDNELEIEDDDDARLIEQVSGKYGDIINSGDQGIDVRQGISSTTVSSLKDGEAVVGVVKKERVEGGRKKAKVVVVSRLSDFNPILVGKLGAECSCKSDSQTLNLRRGGSRPSSGLFRPESHSSVPSREYLPSSTEPPRASVDYLPPSAAPALDSYSSTTTISPDYSNEEESVVEIKPVRKTQRLYTTTGAPVDVSSVEYEVSSRRRPSGQNRVELSQDKSSSKGASFDRYGPGGLRGADETLQGKIDCQRPGLFRHPKYCNKFYACNWDEWKKRFTLHVFNCPVHLAYDSTLGACNWPSKGPACADDNLLV